MLLTVGVLCRRSLLSAAPLPPRSGLSTITFDGGRGLCGTIRPAKVHVLVTVLSFVLINGTHRCRVIRFSLAWHDTFGETLPQRRCTTVARVRAIAVGGGSGGIGLAEAAWDGRRVCVSVRNVGCE